MIHEHRSGIYKWTNTVNGKVYVGSAARGILVRLKEYARSLPNNICHNSLLQRSWNKHGASKFRFSILERCAPDDCLDREEYWIKFCNSTDRRFGYNLCARGSNTLGVRRSEEWKLNMRRNFKINENSRMALIKSNRERIWSEESIQKKSKAASLLWKNEEYRNAQTSARKGKKASAETRLKMSQSRIGRVMSTETKNKMRQSALRKFEENPNLLQDMVMRCHKNSRKANARRWSNYYGTSKVNKLIHGG